MEQKYILVTSEKARFFISQKEANAVLQSLEEKKKYVVIQGSIIPILIPPTVLDFGRWYATENDRLAVSGKRLCKICLKVMVIGDGCICWERNMGLKQQAFKALPSELAPILQQITDKFTWHSLPSQNDETPAIAEPKYHETNDQVLGYEDEETGEILFS